jgi:hypothetical protein
MADSSIAADMNSARVGLYYTEATGALSPTAAASSLCLPLESLPFVEALSSDPIAQRLVNDLFPELGKISMVVVVVVVVVVIVVVVVVVAVVVIVVLLSISFYYTCVYGVFLRISLCINE